jgi:isoleucyl-tRNA synthetase
MHKSAGNVIAPEDLIKHYGAEIIRLWVSAEDYRDNIRLSEEILQRLTEAYRRIRNTCRFLLGNLYDFDPGRDAVSYAHMEELDRWALHKLQDLSERVLRAYSDFEFHTVYHSLHNFCVLDLSSFYLDILKDRLYVSAPGSRARRSAQTAMREILETLVRLMAPVLSFTADEIWRHMTPDERSNVHMELFRPVKQEFRDPVLAERWENILKVRKEVTKALETARKERRIGHSLDADLILGLPPEQVEFFNSYKDTLKYIFIVSSVQLRNTEEVTGGVASEEMPGIRVLVEPSRNPKCERCWVHDVSAGQPAKPPGLCNRCRESLKEMGLTGK